MLRVPVLAALSCSRCRWKSRRGMTNGLKASRDSPSCSAYLRNPFLHAPFSTPRIHPPCICGTDKIWDYIHSTVIKQKYNHVLLWIIYTLYLFATGARATTQDALHTIHLFRQKVFSSSRHTPCRPPPWRQFILYDHFLLMPMSALTLRPRPCLDLGLARDVFPTKKEQFIHELTLFPFPAPWCVPVGAAGIWGPMVM